MPLGMGARNVVDYATLTVSSASAGVGLADASPTLTAEATVKRAVITVEDDQVRYREDGTAPSSSEGHLLNVGDTLQYLDGDYTSVLGNLLFIRVTADAKLKITYYD